MNLRIPSEEIERYASPSQRARVGTEAWGAANLFCPSCDSSHLESTPKNNAAFDYFCSTCNSPFQLKSQSKPFGRKILDSAYSQMRRAIMEDRTPNFFILHYDPVQWMVKSIVLIPHFALALSSVECRKPLSSTARRAGWVGCNILLDKIPIDARIPVVDFGVIRDPTDVREAFKRLQPLEGIKVDKRGWTLEVLNIIRSLGRPQFNLADVYSYAGSLKKLHPQNSHIRDKIRQQLQVIRDLF